MQIVVSLRISFQGPGPRPADGTFVDSLGLQHKQSSSDLYIALVCLGFRSVLSNKVLIARSTLNKEKRAPSKSEGKNVWHSIF